MDQYIQLSKWRCVEKSGIIGEEISFEVAKVIVRKEALSMHPPRRYFSNEGSLTPSLGKGLRGEGGG